MTPAPFGLVVARSTDPDAPSGTFAVVAHEEDAVLAGPAWAVVHLWAVAVADTDDLAGERAVLAVRARYVLPGPLGETFYAFASRAAAEAAVHPLTRTD